MEGDYSMLKIFPMQSANKRVTGGVVQHYVSVVAFKWKRQNVTRNYMDGGEVTRVSRNFCLCITILVGSQVSANLVSTYIKMDCIRIGNFRKTQTVQLMVQYYQNRLLGFYNFSRIISKEKNMHTEMSIYI